MKKPQPVVMRTPESNTLVIRTGKVSKGHQGHIAGSGAHDNRPKRQRTRDSQRRAWQREER